jgi:uncharacterized protein YdhG (YjbR/CyaY superfamily)
MEKLGPDQVPEYLALQSDLNRRQLERIIRIVQQEIPGAKPCISYQIIGFAVGKKKIFYVSGWNDHLSFHGTHKHTNQNMADAYPQWFTLKGMTLQFQAEPELPESIIRQIAQERYQTYLAETATK